MAIADYLRELADERAPLIVAKLADLSGLTAGELPPFREGWRGISRERRLTIVQRLGELADDNVELDFSAVFLATIADDDGEVRLSSIQGLWEYEGRDLIALLIERLRDDPEPGVRAAAALALGRYELLAEYGELRPADVTAIDTALLAAARDGAEAVEVRARAVEALGARNEPWVRDLIDDAYASGNPRLRVSAIHAMGRNCDPEWLPIVIDNLADDDPEVRFEAVVACGSIGEDEAIPHLAEVVERDDDAEVRLAALDALGAIGSVGGSAEARETLEAHARHDDAAVREAVRAALDEMNLADEPFSLFGAPANGNGRGT